MHFCPPQKKQYPSDDYKASKRGGSPSFSFFPLPLRGRGIKEDGANLIEIASSLRSSQ
jgi:hypothetical protein